MKSLTFLLIGLISLFLVPAIMKAENLQAYLSYSVFNTPDNQPYIETYLAVRGASVTHIKRSDGSFQAVVDIQIIFKQNGNDSIVNFAKYELLGPIVVDTSDLKVNFLDVQRFALPEGAYNLEFSIKDRNSSREAFAGLDAFIIEFPDNKLNFSDIEFLSSYDKGTSTDAFVKNGYTLLPYVFNYYPQSASTLSFYAELYNSQLLLGADDFLLNYYIRPFEVDKKMDQYYSARKAKASTVNVLLTSIDITKLPSGNYLLVLEARNRNNEVLAEQQLFFQRYNPDSEFSLSNLLALNVENTFVGEIDNRDTLVEYIKYLYPISTDIERKYAESQLKNGEMQDLQKYFLNFWVERDQFKPQDAWMAYKYKVDQVNYSFGTPSVKGYATDRGRVYLQYGPPDVISEQYNEPTAYPYEIWHYYVLQNQRDKKFVFYTHDIVTNDFQLIHSNAVGELSNYRWQTFIYQRTDPFYDIDRTSPDNSWGHNAGDYYYNPR